MNKSVGTGPSSYEKKFTRPRSHKGWETLDSCWLSALYKNHAIHSIIRCYQNKGHSPSYTSTKLTHLSNLISSRAVSV